MIIYIYLLLKDLFMYFLEVLDTTKSDREAIGVLKAKHQILYVFYHALFNFYASKIFSTLFLDFIDLIFRPY